MAPPSKRQKRNVIPSSPRSDGLDTVQETPARHEQNAANKAKAPVIDLCSSPIEEASPFARPKPTKQPPSPSKARQSTLRNSSTPTALAPPSKNSLRGTRSTTLSASPEKKKRGTVKAEKVKSGNLFTFFSTQVNKQIASNTPPSTSFDIKEEEQISTDDDEIVAMKARQKTSFTSTATKRNRSVLEANGESSIVSSSQRFKKPSISAVTRPKVEEDLRPWAERFAPQNLEELAVHTRKVADVRGWLETVMAGKSRQRLLILKGAAGTGKTTTVQLLAKSMEAEVLEWRNPIGSMNDGEGGGFVSVTQQFEDFLGRGGKFRQLDIFDDSGGSKVKSESDSRPLDHRKSLMLVEEFPNTFTKSSTILQGFRSAILTYLAANTPTQAQYYAGLKSSDPVIPLVMVISENLLTTTSAAADSFTAHRLLGPEILHHPAVNVIEFNPIAPTFLQKALELVVIKESRKSGRRKTPGPLVLKRLGEIGDVRSAIGSLEFLCLQGDDADWGANVNFAGGKGKRGKKDVSLTKMEEESLELVTRREASLGIFHAVGRVVYNKREAEPSNEVLPSYLKKEERPRKVGVVVEELIDETGTDTSTFLSALHENYVLSCNAVDKFPFYSDMDHVNACIDALSDADLMTPSWDGSFNPTGFGGGAGGRGSGGDVSRQDELSFQVAVRGILFGLPDPVTRKAPKEGGLRKGNGREGHQMFYPTSLKLWRKKEEIEGLVDMGVTKVMKGEQMHAAEGITAGAAAFIRSKQGVETWTSSHNYSSRPSPAQHPSTQANKEAEHTPLLVGLGGSARKEMLLERLPYLVKIAKAARRGKPSVLLPLQLPDLEMITKFTGIGAVPQNEEEEAGPADEATVENWATDIPTEPGSPTKQRRAANDRGKLGGSRHDARMVAEQLEKTVLSDDDIED